MVKTTTTLLIAAIALAANANANPMPKGAVPMTPEAILALYADHTVIWNPGTEAYFASDGSVRGFAKNRWLFWGKVSQTGNEICMNNQGMDSKTKKSDGKTTSDCWKWVTAADGKPWTLYSKAFDNRKLDLVKGWYEETKNLKPGNLAAVKYSAMGGQ